LLGAAAEALKGGSHRTHTYPSELIDEEWSAIAPFLVGPASAGGKRRIEIADQRAR
jgi:hypothetical protein